MCACYRILRRSFDGKEYMPDNAGAASIQGSTAPL